MLLYTRIAPPKVPKKRSRAGCAYCKEKKKKCDEKKPCARCIEHSVECVYEAIKPRQRRKRDSRSGFTVSPALDCVSPTDISQWHVPSSTTYYDSDETSPIESPVVDLDSPASLLSDLAVQFPSPSSKDTEQDRQTNGKGQLVQKKCSHANVLIPTTKSLSPDLAMIAPSPSVSPALEFCSPAFSEFSTRSNRRALVDHFCNVLSHLIVFREESGNPFQQLVLPLSHRSSPVMNAIYALAAAHLEYRGVQNAEKSVYFHNKAIQGLSRVIENQGKVNRNEALAAIMLLVYYEVVRMPTLLVQRGRTNIIAGHLKGAFTILSLHQDITPASIFLERAFGFYDVITALSLGTSPLSTAPSAGGLLPVPPLDAPPASPLTNIDTLLGMATKLWPIMHRLSNLLSVKRELGAAQSANEVSKIAVLRAEFEATSQAIKSALTDWKPCLPPNIVIKDEVLSFCGRGGDDMPEMSRLQSTLHNALAYRHSASVYLYRTIYEYASSSPLVQKHAHASLHHCVETTIARGPMGALLWPLFVAACEATGTEDRVLAKKAFREIEERQGMTNIGEAWQVVQEVWRRLDALSDESSVGISPDLWRKICSEMDVTIVFG
ncbi:hypothetical protein F5Y16DRAFT_149866 [Xylariaceae sp. FL0255]|nr:hypothetical protein F5Y16DRAFT_149866 [Xylariaceae sp. FL0255]